ncbi:hypothetical protein CC80DRAFT_546455 [Byssothecium circinans]|uniref:Uncharacterized protein n=1 Tax=Byssothecium circinans TaxID=147558 RepID=A0A6A5UAT3_9PLEO|nr:hypothetical protein CC80DRAFT_546455 [Byssothecium circinans]
MSSVAGSDDSLAFSSAETVTGSLPETSATTVQVEDNSDSLDEAEDSSSSPPSTGDQSASLPQRLSLRKALAIAASQATKPPTFESQLRESQLEAAIVAPTEGSSAATVATTKDDEDGNKDSNTGLDERFADNFDDID